MPLPDKKLVLLCAFLLLALLIILLIWRHYDAALRTMEQLNGLKSTTD